ncbi:hypothetical protein GCM10023170_041510 [Phytohabitans houttuyneae]|uniref:Uncharacterized protein n=1 Tax=Phytohabitans houttuyneae TaxID=1076126 RepID=A0A6V8KJL9_9ACTN|nr:hypothetical protein Phou_068110 [Phytohabitans houttuyneae]
MPSSAATWWHCATASDSIQLLAAANTVTVATPEVGADKTTLSLRWGRRGTGAGALRQNVMEYTVAHRHRAGKRITYPSAAATVLR